MMLTQLATVARSAGLTVIEQPGWQSRGHGPQSSAQTIVCHHTGGPSSGDAPSLNVVQNGRPDLAGPLSHFVLARSGKVYVVAAGLCWHAGAVRDNSYANQNAIGIEAEGTGTAAWPEVQMVAYAKLCKALMTEFHLPVSRVLGHKEVCAPVGRKTDPNFDMNAFRSRITKLTQGVADMLPTDAANDPGPDKWGHVWLHTDQMVNTLSAKLDALAARDPFSAAVHDAGPNTYGHLLLNADQVANGLRVTVAGQQAATIDATTLNAAVTNALVAAGWTAPASPEDVAAAVMKAVADAATAATK